MAYETMLFWFNLKYDISGDEDWFQQTSAASELVYLATKKKLITCAIEKG